MVAYDLAKVEAGVQFSLPAPNFMSILTNHASSDDISLLVNIISINTTISEYDVFIAACYDFYDGDHVIHARKFFSMYLTTHFIPPLVEKFVDRALDGKVDLLVFEEEAVFLA